MGKGGKIEGERDTRIRKLGVTELRDISGGKHDAASERWVVDFIRGGEWVRTRYYARESDADAESDRFLRG